MSSIEREIASSERLLRDLEERREDALSLNRELLRIARRAINLIVRGEVERGFNELNIAMEELTDFLSKIPNSDLCFVFKFMSESAQELAEGLILANILEGREVSRPDQIPPREFLLGLADAVGELRRVALNSLMSGNIARAKDILGTMNLIFEGLGSLAFPDSILPIKRRVDSLRILIDRTSSEIILKEALSGGTSV